MRTELHPVGTEIFTLHSEPFEVCRGSVIGHTSGSTPQYICEVFSSSKGRYEETVPTIFLTAEEIMNSVREISDKFKSHYPLSAFHRKHDAIGSIID